MNISFRKKFAKRYKKCSRKEQQFVRDAIGMFRKNPLHLKLHNHSLHGKWQGYRSINITGDMRAIYRFESKDRAIFTILGTHAELYE